MDNYDVCDTDGIFYNLYIEYQCDKFLELVCNRKWTNIQ